MRAATSSQSVSLELIFNTNTTSREGITHLPDRARLVPCPFKNRNVSTPNFITASASSLMTTTAKSSSFTSSPQPTFSRGSTWVIPQSLKSTSTDISNSLRSTSSLTPNRCKTADVTNKRRISPLAETGNRTRQQSRDGPHLNRTIKSGGGSEASRTGSLGYKVSNSTTRDSQKSSLLSEPRDSGLAVDGGLFVGENEELARELTAEEAERGRNMEKCLNWIAGLPEKFSGMYILQERAPVLVD